ncbi:MAG: hypothetical protein H8F28_03800 [Fibrella sp.]|nr:hypothetical protein [Armatimonadota bacterium]
MCSISGDAPTPPRERSIAAMSDLVSANESWGGIVGAVGFLPRTDFAGSSGGWIRGLPLGIAVL